MGERNPVYQPLSRFVPALLHPFSINTFCLTCLLINPAPSLQLSQACLPSPTCAPISPHPPLLPLHVPCS